MTHPTYVPTIQHPKQFRCSHSIFIAIHRKWMPRLPLQSFNREESWKMERMNCLPESHPAGKRRRHVRRKQRAASSCMDNASCFISIYSLCVWGYVYIFAHMHVETRGWCWYLLQSFSILLFQDSIFYWARNLLSQLGCLTGKSEGLCLYLSNARVTSEFLHVQLLIIVLGSQI